MHESFKTKKRLKKVFIVEKGKIIDIFRLFSFVSRAYFLVSLNGNPVYNAISKALYLLYPDTKLNTIQKRLSRKRHGQVRHFFVAE